MWQDTHEHGLHNNWGDVLGGALAVSIFLGMVGL